MLSRPASAFVIYDVEKVDVLATLCSLESRPVTFIIFFTFFCTNDGIVPLNMPGASPPIYLSDYDHIPISVITRI